MSILANQRRFAVNEHHAMADSGGVLAPDERVDLLEGVIVPMSPIGEQHASCDSPGFCTRACGGAPTWVFRIPCGMMSTPSCSLI